MIRTVLVFGRMFLGWGAAPSNNLVIISCIGEEIQGSMGLCLLSRVKVQSTYREKESMPKQSPATNISFKPLGLFKSSNTGNSLYNISMASVSTHKNQFNVMWWLGYECSCFLFFCLLNILNGLLYSYKSDKGLGFEVVDLWLLHNVNSIWT